MASLDRFERFQNIRRGLGFPKENSPNADQMLHAMFKQEQALNLRLTNTGQPWSLVEYSFPTVSGTREYTVPNPVAANQTAGKVYFVTRVTGNSEISEVPVNFNDFSNAAFDKMQPVGDSLYVQESLAFYRANLQNQSLNIVVSPTPQEVLTYKIRFYVGSLDRLQSALAGTSLVTELTDFLDQCAMRDLIRHAEWKGYSRAENKDKRAEYRADIDFEILRLEPSVDEFIDQINTPVATAIGTWRNRR